MNLLGLIGCIYRHPTMNVSEFNNNYLNTLLQKILKEKKNVFLLGNFNVDLLSKIYMLEQMNLLTHLLFSHMDFPYNLHQLE